MLVFLFPLLTLLFLFLDIPFVWGVNNQCQTSFQAYATPRISKSPLTCSLYNSNTCCDPGNAKRALNWAYEDDGCGVVSGQCLQMTIDLACQINCSPALVVSDLQTVTGMASRPTICYDYAQAIWSACSKFSWCGTSQLDTSTCTFLQQKTARAASGGGSVTTEVTVNAWDTCTIVGNIDPITFANQILNVAVAPQGQLPSDTTCINPSTQTIPPRSSSAPPTLQITTLLVLPMMFVIMSLML